MKKILFLFITILFFFGCEEVNSHNQEPYPDPDLIVVDSLKIHRKVLIIGIDGFRSDVMNEAMTPFMFSIQNRNGNGRPGVSLAPRATVPAPPRRRGASVWPPRGGAHAGRAMRHRLLPLRAP